MKIQSLPLDAQIFAAVARKAQAVQKQEGAAALALISGAAETAPGPDGRGRMVSVKA